MPTEIQPGARKRNQPAQAVDPPDSPPQRPQLTSKPRTKRTGRQSLENEHARQKKQKHDADPDSDHAVADSASPESDDDSEPLPLSQAWSHGMARFFDRIEANRETSDSQVDRIAELISRHRIGGAYVHGFGIGHLSAVIDPQLRRNPRSVNRTHLAQLVKAFYTPGAKSDHQTPIVLMVPRASVEPACLQKMSGADARDPTSQVPRLALVHPASAELAALETCVITSQEGGRWLSEPEIQDKLARLKELRAEGAKAVLLNGNHRIQAVLEIGATLMESLRKFRQRVRSGSASQRDIELELGDKGLMRKSALASYRVEVYDAETIPEELVNWLVRNEDPRRAAGMAGGESAWWLADNFNLFVQKARESGLEARAEVMDAAYAAWASSRLAPLAEEEPSAGAEAKPNSRRKGDWAGPGAVGRLFTSPLTMEMVLDTKDAAPAYDQCLKTAHAVGMLQDSGALLACRFWLAARTLLQIFNIVDCPGLTDAHDFVRHSPDINSLGEPAAVPHYKRLLSDGPVQPALIRGYTAEFSKRFDQLYCAALDRAKHPARAIEWLDGPTIRLFRKVFDDFGRWVLDQKPDWCLKVGVALRLYARLPLYSSSRTLPCFFPTSALPAPGWLDREYNERQEFKSSAGLTLLEYAIDPHLPMWTIGAQPFGSSRNNRNWYSRSRGLHQLALLRLQFGTGNESQNLDEAIGVLSDVRLRKALQELAAGSGQDIDLLRKSCCTSRSSTNEYAILRDYRAELEEHFGSYDRGIREFHKARKSLKDYVTPYSDEPDHSLSAVPQEYPVLSLVTSNHFWSQAPVLSWIFGWNTQVKRFQDVNSALGWALLAKRMEPMFEDLMHQSRPARHVLAVAKDLSTKRGHAPWWQRLGLSLPSHGYPSPPASEVDEHSGSVASGEADHGIANGAEEDVAPPPGRPSDGAPPGDRQNEGSQAPSIENSENEHEVGRDRTRDDTPAAPDKRGALASPCSSRTPVQPSAPPPSPCLSQPRSWQEDGQPEEPWQAGSPPTAISTRTQRFSPSPIPADPATVPTHQFFESRVPGHVLTRHCRSHNTLESLISESSHNPSLSVSQLHRAIKLHETKVETLLPAIALERQKLRETIIAYAEPCVKAPYGAFVADTALSPLLFQIKNIYVANVALLLQSHLEMTLEEALNEAAAIATFDGLYTTEIKQFHAEGRGLELNLRATFCQSYQDEAAPDATITLGTLPDCSKDRKKMIGALGYFHAPLGPGRTEAESCARGIDSATLVLSKFARRKCPYLQVHIAIHPPATEDRPPVDCSVPWDDLVHSTNDPISRWQATKHELSEQPVPNAAEQCWLSTGRLAPIEHISEAKLARGDTGLAARLQQVVRTSLQHWAETQHADIVAHRSFMAMRDGRNGLSVPPYSASNPHGASPVASRGHSSLNLHSAELSGPRDAKLNPVRGQPRSGPTPVTPHRLRSDFAGPGHPPPAPPPSRGLGARSPLHTPDPQEESDGEYSSHDESESYRRQRRALNQTALRPMDEQESDTEYISSSESTS